jgi:hypothetical protein
VSDNDLLRQLGQVARAREDARWDGRSPGPADDEERAALGPAAETLAPADETRRTLARALARRALREPAPAWDDAPAPPALQVAPPISEVAANVPAPHHAARRWRPALVAGLAVAAAAMLWVATPQPEGPGASWSVTDVRGAAITRGGPQPVTLVPGDTLRLVLQPDRPVSGPLEAEVALTGGAAPLPLASALEVSPTGSLRLRAQLPAELPPDAAGLRVTIRRPGADAGVLQVTDLPAAR